MSTDLRNKGIIIRDETQEGANTANRVGSWMVQSELEKADKIRESDNYKVVYTSDGLIPEVDLSELNEAVFTETGGWETISGITFADGYYVDLDGTIQGAGANASYKLSSPIPIALLAKYRATLRAGNILAISGWNGSAFAPALAIPGTDTNNPLVYSFTAPGSNITHVRLSCRKEYSTPKLEKFNETGQKVNRIDLLETEVDQLQAEIRNEAIVATIDNFTGSKTITGTGVITAGLFQFPVNIAIEDIDFFAKIKVNTVSVFGLCRPDTAGYGTIVAVNGNQLEVRKMAGNTGTKIYSYLMPFTVTAGKTYIVRMYKYNKDMYISVHSDTDFYTQFVERTDTFDFGRNWGNPSVFCQSGQIEIIDANIRNENFQSPVTLAFGDSLIEGWGVVNSLEKRYIALTQQYTQGNVFIAGRGGESTTSLKGRFITELAKINSKYVFLDVGTNDTVIATYTANMNTFISQIKASGRIPILATVTPRSGSYPITAMNAFVRASGELYVDKNAAVNNGTETAWNPLFVNSDNVHPNVLGNEAIFKRILFDLYFLFDTRVVYNTLNNIGELLIPTGTDIATPLKAGSYIQPFTGQILTSADYHRTNEPRAVKLGDILEITGCFAYNSTTPASNSGIAGYSGLTEDTYVVSVFDLTKIGITATGRHQVIKQRITITDARIKYILGSSCFQNASGLELPLSIVVNPDTMPIVPFTTELGQRVSALEEAAFKTLDLTPDIEQGTISDINGTNVAITTRIRTAGYHPYPQFEVAKINAGFRYIVFEYSDAGFISTAGWQTTAKAWQTSGTRVRLAFSKTSGANITPAEFGDIGFEMIVPTSGGGTTTITADVITRNFEAEKAVMAVRKKFSTQTTTNETDIFTLAHTSDLHGDVIRLKNFIEYSKYIGVDAATVTGDIVEQYFTDDFSYYVSNVSASPIPTFNTVGNHEAQNGGTDEQIEAKFFTPLVAQNGSVTSGKGYYYRDFATKKIRIIGINQFQQGGTVREKRYLKDDQITWLIATLKSTPANYGIIILTHIPEHEWNVVTGYEKFWQSQMFFTDLYTNITGSPIADLMDAFIGRTSINKSYTQSGTLSTLTINTSFATGVNTGVEFMAYLNGHLHVDRVGYLNNTTHKQLVLNIICGNAFVSQWRDGLGDLPRKAGTVVEDAFNVYGFDQTLGVVKIARVGSNVNYRMEKRDFMMIPYK